MKAALVRRQVRQVGDDEVYEPGDRLEKISFPYEHTVGHPSMCSISFRQLYSFSAPVGRPHDGVPRSRGNRDRDRPGARAYVDDATSAVVDVSDRELDECDAGHSRRHHDPWLGCERQAVELHHTHLAFAASATVRMRASSSASSSLVWPVNRAALSRLPSK